MIARYGCRFKATPRKNVERDKPHSRGHKPCSPNPCHLRFDVGYSRRTRRRIICRRGSYAPITNLTTFAAISPKCVQVF